MRKKTLNQTWTLCLKMWKWIKRVWVPGMNVHALKKQWFRKHVGGNVDVCANCFFCAYGEEIGCCDCPGRLVDPEFSCNNVKYAYDANPPAFYRELLRLNRIRRANKPKRPGR